tara:strand:+ start:9704 stop:11053 length:1350 start_codon:yes stop_codon:yes gene_type:complete
MIKEKKVLTRFAPSPTGDLHIGNARSAILNWIYSKKYNGEFILRIDDTDKERSKEKFIQSIKEDLNWLGLDYSYSFKQSERKSDYNKSISFLKNSKRLYPCFETLEELQLKRKSLLSSGKPPIYDRKSLDLLDKQIEDLISQGKKPHWRFFLEDKKIIWDDLIRGEAIFNPKNLSDPILIREDESLLYHLPSVIDDISENITDIIRGEDHVNNTAFHIQIFEALKSKTPNFGHHPLLTDEFGKGLAKRLGSLSIKDIREEGFDSLTIINYLSTIGSSKNITSEIDINEILKSYNIKNLARSSPKFDNKDLVKINSDIIKKLSFKDVEKKLENLGVKNSDINFWNFIKNNINLLKESVDWWEIITSSKIFYEKDKDFLIKCSLVLPEEPFDLTTWDQWLGKIKNKSNRKGKELFMPLRLALTGKETGPELKYLLPLLSRKTILNRLGSKE